MHPRRDAVDVPPYHAAMAGNAFMLATFSALIPIGVFIGIRYKTPMYISPMITGLLVEVVGHSGAALMQINTGSRPLLCLYLLGSIWGGTLVGVGNYVALPRVMVIYGKAFSLVSRPAYCTVLFAVLDTFALVFQSVGVVWAVSKDAESKARHRIEALTDVPLIATGHAGKAYAHRRTVVTNY